MFEASPRHTIRKEQSPLWAPNHVGAGLRAARLRQRGAFFPEVQGRKCRCLPKMVHLLQALHLETWTAGWPAQRTVLTLHSRVKVPRTLCEHATEGRFAPSYETNTVWDTVRPFALIYTDLFSLPPGLAEIMLTKPEPQPEQYLSQLNIIHLVIHLFNKYLLIYFAKTLFSAPSFLQLK